MKKLSEAVKLPQSGIRRMFDLAKDKKDVVSFCLGEPDFDTPKHIVDAAKASLDEGRTHYTDNAGILPLREAVAEALQKYDNVEYNPATEIQITIGGMQAIYLAMVALLDPGDEVLISNPSYANYVGQVAMNHGVAVPVPVYEKDGFNYTYEGLKEKVTDKTKAILLNSPCNPTGGVASKETMEAIARIAKEYDLYVIYDAVYKHLVYDDMEYINIASLDGMKERTIYIDSFSKTYAMTGWRLGYMAGPANIISLLPKLQENMPSCVPEFIQRAGIQALKHGDEDIQRMNNEYVKRRNLLIGRINNMKYLSCKAPKGAFYAFVNIKETGMNSQEFCEKLLEEQNVVTAPGTAFGTEGDGYIRLSYATSLENIEAGMDRIEAFVSKL